LGRIPLLEFYTLAKPDEWELLFVCLFSFNFLATGDRDAVWRSELNLKNSIFGKKRMNL
jgi:hypothetical protein